MQEISEDQILGQEHVDNVVACLAGHFAGCLNADTLNEIGIQKLGPDATSLVRYIKITYRGKYLAYIVSSDPGPESSWSYVAGDDDSMFDDFGFPVVDTLGGIVRAVFPKLMAEIGRRTALNYLLA